jgi:hypothetical protein
MPSSTSCVPTSLSALLPSAALLPSFLLPPLCLLSSAALLTSFPLLPFGLPSLCGPSALLPSAALLPFSPLGDLLTYMYVYLCVYFQSDALLYT